MPTEIELTKAFVYNLRKFKFTENTLLKILEVFNSTCLDVYHPKGDNDGE